MKKKIPAVIAAATMLFPLNACAKVEESKTSPEEDTTKNEVIDAGTIKDLQNQIDKLKEENEKLKESNQKLSSGQTEILAKILKIIDTQDALKEDLSLKADKTSLESLTNSLQQVVDDFEAKQEVDTEKLNALETSISSFMIELDRVKKQVESLQDNSQVMGELQTIHETLSGIQEALTEIKIHNAIKSTFNDYVTVDGTDSFYYTSPDGEYVKTTQDGDVLRLFTNDIAFHAYRGENNLESGAEAVDEYIIRLLNENNASYGQGGNYIFAQLDEGNSAMFIFGSDGKIDQIQVKRASQEGNQNFYISNSNKNVFNIMKKMAIEKIDSYKLYDELNSAVDKMRSFDFIHVFVQDAQIQSNAYCSNTKTAVEFIINDQKQQAYSENGVVHGDENAQGMMGGVDSANIVEALKNSIWDGVAGIKKENDQYVIKNQYSSLYTISVTDKSFQVNITSDSQNMTQTISQISEDEFNTKFNEIKTAVDNLTNNKMNITESKTK